MSSPNNAAAAATKQAAVREKKNWLINMLYVRQEFKECMEVVEEQLRESNGMCEYAIYADAWAEKQNAAIDTWAAFFLVI